MEVRHVSLMVTQEREGQLRSRVQRGVDKVLLGQRWGGVWPCSGSETGREVSDEDVTMLVSEVE